MPNGEYYYIMRTKSLKKILHTFLVSAVVVSSFSYLLTGRLDYQTPTALADPPKATCADGTVQYVGTCSQHGGIGKAELTIENSNKMRSMLYLRDCLLNHLDYNGKYNDGNNKNVEFSGWEEVFKQDGEVIATGPDFDSKNGVQTCPVVARVGIEAYDSTISDYKNWLMKKLWGKTISENNGKALKVGSGSGEIDPDDVKANASSLARDLKAKADNINRLGTSKKITLQRLKPLMTQCYKDWTDKPTSPYTGKGDIRMPGREVYARVKTFDWDEIKIVDIDGNSGPDFKGAQLGDIDLGFAPGSGSNSRFNDRTSEWFPVGTDLPQSIIGAKNYKNYEDQTFLNCDWILNHSDFLFKQSVDNEFYFKTEGNSLKIATKRINAEGEESEEIVDSVSTSGTAGGSDPEDTSCKIAGAMGWILGPICKASLEATQTVGEYVTDALVVPLVTQSEKNGTVYDAWRSFRDVANAFLVLIFLIAIFYQVLPIEMDAYTVKKVLPRLIMAAIAIQASFFICQVLIDISNVLGGGVQTIFQQLGTEASTTTADNVNMVNSALSVAVAGGVAIAFIGPVFFLLLAAVVSIITMIISIQAREVIIIFLVLASPIAFLAGVLPNTENWFKKWGSNFIKLLLMYPLIQAILSGSYMISKVLNVDDAGGGGTIKQIMLSFIPVIALFMIPSAFKASGALMGAIGSAGFGKASSLTNRSKSSAAAQAKGWKDNFQKSRAISGADKSYGAVRRFGNRALSGAGIAGSFGMGKSAKYNQAQRAEAGLQDKIKLISAELTEKGLNGDNAQLKNWFDNGGKGRSKAEQIAAMQMLGDNGGIEELSSIYDKMEAENGGVHSSKWKNKDQRDIWQQGTTNSRQALAKALPYSVRPDHNKSFGKLDSEGFASLKGVAGKGKHISKGLGGIKQDINKAVADRDAALAAGNRDLADTHQATIDNKQGQLQKAFTSMVGVGQSTDRRGRIDADVVKDWATAVSNGELDGITLDVGGAPMTAREFAATYITENNQLRAVPTAGAKAVAAGTTTDEEGSD